MSTLVDLLISEVSNFLNITPDEIRAKFTKKQLEELLSNSLCEPIDESGIPIKSLDFSPCDDLAIPDLLPESIVDLDALQKVDNNNATKCIENIEEINKNIQKQLDEYMQYSTLLTKLIEYKDNYEVIGYYYIERDARTQEIFQKIIDSRINTDNLSPSELIEFREKITVSRDDLLNLRKKVLPQSLINSTKKILTEYSECVDLKSVPLNFTTTNRAMSNTFFDFRMKFVDLKILKLEKEVTDTKTGERHIEKYDFPIYNNPLLTKRKFFENTDTFEISEFKLDSDQLPTGSIYEDYYNLFVDPIENFFTINERGLTKNENLVDPNLKGTDGEIKREGDKEYYIQDLDRMQNFYKDFEDNLAHKTSEKRELVITTRKKAIKAHMKKLAIAESQLIFEYGRYDQYKAGGKNRRLNLKKRIEHENLEFIEALNQLNSEIVRVESKLVELKPTPEKIKALLKKESPECFDNIDQDTSPCSSVMSKLGTDPMGTKTLEGADPTLPNQNKMCYWLQFSLIANLMGLLPMPNIPDATALRYWPVGFTIPSPGGLIKIPLPIIWIPLIAIPSPLGTLVIFLTINGIFISPIVFFVSSSGTKQHIITAKGSGEKIGYTSDDESIKPDIQSSVSILAAKGKVDRLTKEAQYGKYFNLPEPERNMLNQSKLRLDKVEQNAKASGNENRLMKVKREKKNLDRASSTKSSYEKMAGILDKGDSAVDLIDQVRHAIFNQFDKIGKPALTSTNKLKDKISKRDSKKFKAKQKALADNKPEEASRISSEMQSDGISLSSKISAISDDMFAYFDKINLPKVTIPKDASTIDPKPNAIQELASTLTDFGDTFKTQFKSVEDSQVNTILSKQVAKSKQTISDELDKIKPAGGKFDIDKDIDKVKEALSKITSIVIGAASGQNIPVSYADQTSKIADLNNKIESESDPNKKIALNKVANKERAKLSEIYELEQTRDAMQLTPEIMSMLSGASVDFNPFSPCCDSKPFTLPTIPSPAIAVFETIKEILGVAVIGLTVVDLKALFGGKSKISIRELTSGYLGLLNQNISKDIKIPLPDLNLASFAGSFTGLFASLFEPKAPILAAQPAMPASITIDLNILKAPLKALLRSYLDNSLPSINSTGSSPNNPSISSSYTGKKSDAILDKRITILDGCDPSPENSTLSGGNLSRQPKRSTSSSFDNNRVIIDNTKDILPAFQNLDLDFMNVNPGDLLVILKNFIDTGLDKIESIIEPFYSLLSVVKSPKNTNLNVVEFAQQKVPPTGPADEALFTAITQLKKAIPKSATINIVDDELVKTKSATIETILTPIINSPLPQIMVVGAGALDSIMPTAKIPSINTSGSVNTQDLKVSSYALRQLNPVVSQDDIPPWERLSPKNILFLLFIDQFIGSAADKVGLFRNYL